MPARFLTALLASLLAMLVGTGIAEARPMLDPNPADQRPLVRMNMDRGVYHGGSGCTQRIPRGTRVLRRWLRQNTMRRVASGITRCDGGVHGTGRALDWMLDARKRRQRRAAMRVINTWVAADRRGRRAALARRMGIQMIIYNCRIWMPNRGWRTYGVCRNGRRGVDPTQAHIDHIHVELNRRGARMRTSFWRHWLAERNGGESGNGDAGNGDSTDASGTGGISPG